LGGNLTGRSWKKIFEVLSVSDVVGNVTCGRGAWNTLTRSCRCLVGMKGKDFGKCRALLDRNRTGSGQMQYRGKVRESRSLITGRDAIGATEGKATRKNLESLTPLFVKIWQTRQVAKKSKRSQRRCRLDSLKKWSFTGRTLSLSRTC